MGGVNSIEASNNNDKNKDKINLLAGVNSNSNSLDNQYQTLSEYLKGPLPLMVDINVITNANDSLSSEEYINIVSKLLLSKLSYKMFKDSDKRSLRLLIENDARHVGALVVIRSKSNAQILMAYYIRYSWKYTDYKILAFSDYNLLIQLYPLTFKETITISHILNILSETKNGIDKQLQHLARIILGIDQPLDKNIMVNEIVGKGLTLGKVSELRNIIEKKNKEQNITKYIIENYKLELLQRYYDMYESGIYALKDVSIEMIDSNVKVLVTNIEKELLHVLRENVNGGNYEFIIKDIPKDDIFNFYNKMELKFRLENYDDYVKINLLY